jgi:tRNA-2-methylthio-N6-dimethylallyladenosine synthase
MSKAESERLGAALEQKGYMPAPAPELAGIHVVNTCVVRQSAEDRVVNRLHLLRQLKKKNPELILAVTGCFVDSDEAALRKRFPYIDHFFRPGEVPGWLSGAGADPTLKHPPVSVYIPIMQGCNNFCSYCIVPFRRGRERSRLPAEIVSEAREIVDRGGREMVLLGQNVDSYGQDLPERPELADLLEQLNEIPGLVRLRFLTSHPKDMTQRLISRVARLDKVCEHINLPVQSGDDSILEVMRRGYSVDHYRRLIESIRHAAPSVALSTDVIVGFPSETTTQFENTVRLLSELRFDTVHAACYSPRTGTLAARQLVDDVPPEEKKRRLQVVEALHEQIATEINNRLLGTIVEVLVEGKTRGKWRGRTRGDKLVFFVSPAGAADKDFLGCLVNVRIEKAGPWSLQGKAEPPRVIKQEER